MTTRLQKYISNFERVRHIKDVIFLREKLQSIGVNKLDKLIEFQLTYGGYVEYLRKNKFVYGFIHENPNFLKPNEIDYEIEDGLFTLFGADAHISFGMMIDPNGVYYFNCIPNARSFELKLERDAYYAEKWKKHDIGPVKLKETNTNYLDELLLEIKDFEIHELSDEFSSWFFRENVMFINRKYDSKNILEVYLNPSSIPKFIEKLNFGKYY